MIARARIGPTLAPNNRSGVRTSEQNLRCLLETEWEDFFAMITLLNATVNQQAGKPTRDDTEPGPIPWRPHVISRHTKLRGCQSIPGED
jgi:hypothetical protein